MPTLRPIRNELAKSKENFNTFTLNHIEQS